ncbi:Glycoprotein-N-acetylgalactosamine 3-beta-galactosyltransferase 1 [Strongyloides ratti]|uniref:N-acetylgalactosaminide beta-1,3-galactosyltransferase n=1 Tax=Strongyloides ratti TaxID=34506 RepID=A0A090KY41_STRRB|nr:Glycoprotein-N-acetylgalactosamine 3-beta-galactosyltransferase 1 [Strongyloides ratti]CEF62341.1 Glycoprotein-N-acetylgalactosamine 3-beta-galactosyltransferase 1 [Strongyloides ratti]
MEPNFKKFFNNSFDDSVFNMINEHISKKVKIFCIVLTSKVNRERIILQKKTWIKRCNNYIFGSGEESQDIPTFKAYHNDGYSYSFGKMKNTLKHVWKKHGDKYDWYLKADDDTYVVMENLRAFLLNENPNKHGYHGFRMAIGGTPDPHAYNSGGAGYVMSKKSVRDLVEKGLDNPKYCRQIDSAFDDLEIGYCLENLGALPSQSLDCKKRVLFNVLDPPRALSPVIDGFKQGFINMAKFKYNPSFDSVADFPITFHYVRGEMMYALEFLMYHMEVIGRNSRLNRMESNDNTFTKLKVSKKLKLINKFSEYNFKKY